MLDAIRSFVNRRLIVEATPEAAPAPLIDGLQVAAAALLLELAHADGHFNEAERRHIEAGLGRHFALDEDTSDSSSHSPRRSDASRSTTSSSRGTSRDTTTPPRSSGWPS